MLSRLCRLVLTLALGLAGLAAGDRAEATLDPSQRHALVVGNGDYSFSPLPNPLNDARAMAGELGELGFEVTLLENATQAEFEAAVERMSASFADDGVGLFYYAGHAVQYQGVNYLLPTNFEVEGKIDLAATSININDVLQAMERSGSGLNLVILDACRNYPFGEIDEAFGQGLAGVTTAGETLVAYATTAGDVALDGVGPNSPYTAALISALELPGYDVYDVFRVVRGKVRQATNNRQLPWISGSIESRLVLHDTGPVQLASAEVSLPLVYWNTIQNSVDPADFESFVRSNPASPFARGAIERLQQLLAEGRVPVAELVVEGETLLSPAGQALEVTPCDVWASDPRDPRRIAPGVEWGVVNTRQAIRACMEAVNEDRDSPRLSFQLGRALDIAERMQEARFFYDRSAAADYPAAIKNLGYMARTGRGQDQDFTAAAELYFRAALLGLDSARDALSKLHEMGWGVPQSDAERLRWLRLAAEDGFVPALDAMGNLYRTGRGVETDPVEAVRYYRAAALLGNTNAMNNLARVYQQGEGIAPDLNEALRWFRRATDEGNPYAPYHLGELLRQGEQVARDPAQAMALFELAAERGFEWAYWKIADMYRNGELGPKDPAKAYYNLWIARAAGQQLHNQGSEKLAKEAGERLEQIRPQLDDATALAVEQQAETWLAQNSLFQFSLVSFY